MSQLIGETRNGKVFRCDKCNAVHVEFKNLGFKFSDKQFSFFVKSILELNGSEWEEKNKDSYFTRKIMIPAGNNNINILLNCQELDELKKLLIDRTGTTVIFSNISDSNLLHPLFCN